MITYSKLGGKHSRDIPIIVLQARLLHSTVFSYMYMSGKTHRWSVWSSTVQHQVHWHTLCLYTPGIYTPKCLYVKYASKCDAKDMLYILIAIGQSRSCLADPNGYTGRQWDRPSLCTFILKKKCYNYIECETLAHETKITLSVYIIIYMA